jgi:hypothetical protein
MAFRSTKPTKNRQEERFERADDAAQMEAAAPAGVSTGGSAPSRRAEGRRRRKEGEHRAMLGPRRGRFRVESLFMRLIATGGILGIGVLLGIVLVSQDVAGWIVGLCVSGVSLLLAALLWSSDEL